MDLVQRLHWFADTQDTAIFWGGCEGHFPIDDMREAAKEIERLKKLLASCRRAMEISNSGPTDWHHMIAAIDTAL